MSMVDLLKNIIPQMKVTEKILITNAFYQTLIWITHFFLDHTIFRKPATICKNVSSRDSPHAVAHSMWLPIAPPMDQWREEVANVFYCSKKNLTEIETLAKACTQFKFGNWLMQGINKTFLLTCWILACSPERTTAVVEALS